MISVLVGPGLIIPGTAMPLDEDECHHLRVRRVESGITVRVLDGAGGVGQGMVELGPRAATVRIERVDRVEPPAPLRLLVAAGDHDRFGWLAEKCAELGVTELLPLETERTPAVGSRLRDGHLDRLRRRARGAIKQSGAAWAPVVSATLRLEAAVNRAGDGPRWLADPAGLPANLAGGAPEAVAVGPEGGFTSDERAFLVRAGFKPVRLGPHVMRFETAALAAAALARASSEGNVHE